MKINRLILTLTVLAMPFTAMAQLVSDFTETFATDAANWRNGALNPVAYSSSGGPGDSAFISSSLTLAGSEAADTSVIMFRAQDGFDSSGDAFVGNWLASNVDEFSIFVRHNATSPLNFFARFAASGNFPGAVAVDFTPVFANTWTQITFDVSADSSQFVSFEGTNHAAVFSSVGNIQVGFTPGALAGSTPTITVDGASAGIITVPEPTSLALLGGMGALALFRRQRRRSGPNGRICETL